MTGSIQPRKYMRVGSNESLENEIRDLEEQRRIDMGQPPAPPPADPGNPDANGVVATPDATWEKRYADLRRHTQARDAEFKRRITALETSLTQAVATGNQLPTTEEELEVWMQEYPEQTRVIQALAMKVSDETQRRLDDRLALIEEREADIDRAFAVQQLMGRHPDFETIKSDPKFHDWLALQPSTVQDALLVNNTDWVAASRALDLYKLDIGQLTPPKNTRNQGNNSAAMAVNTKSSRSTPPQASGSQGRIYKESEIARMRVQEFERLEDDIMKARAEGRIDLDLSRAR